MANVLQIEVNDELMAKLQALADDMGRSVEEIHAFALEDFVVHEREIVDAVLEGKRDCEAERTIPHEEVVAWMNSLFTDHPLPRPEPKGQPLSRAS
jgi:predicted transcriptional regulator